MYLSGSTEIGEESIGWAVADIVQCGPNNCKVLRIEQIELLSWLAALDDFRNWLIREAA